MLCIALYCIVDGLRIKNPDINTIDWLCTCIQHLSLLVPGLLERKGSSEENKVSHGLNRAYFQILEILMSFIATATE